MSARLPCYQGRTLRPVEPEPDPSPSAPIRDRLALERARLDQALPEALEQTSELLSRLHLELRGEVARLAPLLGRTDRYLRGELLGEHGMPVEDLVALRILRPAAVAPALLGLASLGGAEVGRESIGQAGADLARAVGEFQARLVEALDDGVITLAEMDSLRVALDEVEHRARGARVELLRRRP